MHSKYSYTTVDRVISKFFRDTKDTSISESDLIEWIGEAMGFINVSELNEEAVAFVKVSDYEIDMPPNLKIILQIARNNHGDPNTYYKEHPNRNKSIDDLLKKTVPYEESDMLEHPLNQLGYPIPLDSNGTPITDYELAYYRPYYDLQYEYNLWINSPKYRYNYTPVRLANSTFFNSIVCREKNIPYHNIRDEYTIVGTSIRKIRFSFKEGFVAISYLKNLIDSKTGYPLIPDDSSFLSAITYYIKWKIAEYHQWNGRAGFNAIAQQSQQNWLRYCKQAKNNAKMPSGIDELQNMLEESHYLIPRLNRYYGFFGNLSTPENRNFERL